MRAPGSHGTLDGTAITTVITTAITTAIGTIITTLIGTVQELRGTAAVAALFPSMRVLQ